MIESAKYTENGSVAAVIDGQNIFNITPSSRFWPIVMEGTNNGKDITPFVPEPEPVDYRIGKSTPWRRMTDSEAIKVSDAMKQQTVKNQMIYDAASYIDTSDELFGTLKALLTSLFSAARADELLAREE